jgi:hypothetical protein
MGIQDQINLTRSRQEMLQGRLSSLKERGSTKGWSKSMSKRQSEMMKELEGFKSQSRLLLERQTANKAKEVTMSQKQVQQKEVNTGWGSWTAGLGAGLGMIGGTLLAPFTGGASIAVGMGIGTLLGGGVGYATGESQADLDSTSRAIDRGIDEHIQREGAKEQGEGAQALRDIQQLKAEVDTGDESLEQSLTEKGDITEGEIEETEIDDDNPLSNKKKKWTRRVTFQGEGS